MTLPLRKNLLLAIACAFLSLLALSACGGGDDDDTSGDDGGATAATEDSGNGDNGDNGETDDAEEPTDDGGDDDEDDGDVDDGIITGSDANPAACELLTTAEITEATGFDVGDGEAQEYSEDFFGCSWQAENLDSVDITVINGREQGDALYNFQSDDAEDIDDLGDKAHYLPGILALLEFIEDDYYVSITVNSIQADEEGTREASLELAHIAVDRLP